LKKDSNCIDKTPDSVRHDIKSRIPVLEIIRDRDYPQHSEVEVEVSGNRLLARPGANSAQPGKPEIGKLLFSAISAERLDGTP